MISPLAYVHPDARIGEGVEIGPFCNISANVEIGARTKLLGSVTVMDGARIGEDCTVFPGAVIAGIPQDMKFRGEESLAIIGNRCTLRECVTVNRGTASKGKTVVGDDCLIMAYSHVAHDCVLGNKIIMSNATQLAGEVVVDDCAVIGGGTLVHQFSHIGAYVMIQGGALINKDIPPYILAAREPISFVGLNVVGLRRRGFSEDKIEIIQRVYNVLFLSGLNITNALEKIESEIPSSPIRDEIIDFVRKADRGIVKGMR
ncbi:MAG: acyl-ACP--UDP-N-acetylglucosamine O-acyltransferase [Muribaculaceae bacterium]|nr:acyl-ACP--UDP-N-acetylglucosamine O-acyltransferase [Muribaculaceae bacterium]